MTGGNIPLHLEVTALLVSALMAGITPFQQQLV